MPSACFHVKGSHKFKLESLHLKRKMPFITTVTALAITQVALTVDCSWLVILEGKFHLSLRLHIRKIADRAKLSGFQVFDTISHSDMFKQWMEI